MGFPHTDWYNKYGTPLCTRLKFLNDYAFLCLKVLLFLVNTADPDEMQLHAAFHLALHCLPKYLWAQWLSGRVLDSRSRGWGFEPHRRHYVKDLEQDIIILA